MSKLKLNLAGIAFRMDLQEQKAAEKPRVFFPDRAYMSSVTHTGKLYMAKKQVDQLQMADIKVTFNKKRVLIEDDDTLDFTCYIKGKRTAIITFTLIQAEDTSGIPKEMIKENSDFLLKEVLQINSDGSTWFKQVLPLPALLVGEIIEQKFYSFRQEKRYKDIIWREKQLGDRILAEGCEYLDGAMYAIFAYTAEDAKRVEAWSLVNDDVYRADLHYTEEIHWDNVFAKLYIDRTRGKMLSVQKNMEQN